MSAGAVSDRDVPGVVRSLRREAPALARAVIDRYVEESGLYTPDTVPDHLYRDSLHSMRTFIDTALRAVLDHELDVQAAMRVVIDRGNDRVAEGVPLRNYLHCWQLGLETLVDALDERLEGDRVATAPVFGRVREVYDAIIRDAVSAYELTSREVVAAQIGRSARLVAHLLDGVDYPFEDDPGTVPEHPVVVLIEIGPTRAELSGSDQTRNIAALRKARRTRASLQRSLEGIWLADVRGLSARLITSAVPRDLNGAVELLQQTHAVPVTAAYAQAANAGELPRAAELAVEVLAVALRNGRSGMASSIEDVALEHHLAHRSPSLDVLLRRCEPLRARGELVETLRAYFDNDLDRRRAAAALHVHPNTVDNRLARIRELTDLDARHLQDLFVLAVGTVYAGGADVTE